MKPKVLLIIPAYNESESLPATLAEVLAYQREEHPFTLEYVVINDGSTDLTTEVCAEHHIEMIDLPFNLGIGGAVQTGYLFAHKLNFDMAVQYDGDGQHDIAYLETLLAPVLAGQCDMAVGSRFINETSRFKSTFSRRVGIRILSFILLVCTGLRSSDPTSGFRAANREAFAFLSENYPVDYPEPESLAELKKRGFRIQDVAVEMRAREKGVSSISAIKSAYYMIKVSLAIVCQALARASSGRVPADTALADTAPTGTASTGKASPGTAPADTPRK